MAKTSGRMRTVWAVSFIEDSGFFDLGHKLTWCSSMPQGRLQWRASILLPAADSQCRRADDYILAGKFFFTFFPPCMGPKLETDRCG